MVRSPYGPAIGCLIALMAVCFGIMIAGLVLLLIL